MTWPAPTSPSATIRAADDDRERALELLREHWLAGRLTLVEYEERCDEVARARFLGELQTAIRELPVAPPPPPGTQPNNNMAFASCILGITSLAFLAATMGFAAILSLPMSVAAWALGRNGKRRAGPSGRSFAIAGEVTGIVGTVISLLAVTACAVVITSL
jgi:hypothetical protein